MGVDREGNHYVLGESCVSGLTLTAAAERIAALCRGHEVTYAVASPDLWNRRQDSGKSGFEIMQRVEGMPPMIAADDRRIPGWRVVREYLAADHAPHLRIGDRCDNLISSLPALLCHTERPEDASGEPHAVTHSPEALRYALMSRCPPPEAETRCDFVFRKPTRPSIYD